MSHSPASRSRALLRALITAVTLGLPAAAHAADVYWEGGDAGGASDFNLPANWVGDALPVLYDEAANSTNGDVAVFDGVTVPGAIKTPTFTGAFGDGVNNSTAWGLQGVRFVDSGWTLDTGANTLFISQRGTTDLRSEANSGTNTVNGSIRFGARDNNDLSSIYVESGGTLRLNASVGVVIDGGGNTTGGVEKVGEGLLEMNTTGAFGSGGGLIVRAGTVRFFAETAGGVTGNGTGGLGTGFSAPLNIQGGLVDVNGVATLNIRAITSTASGTLHNGSLTISSITARAFGNSTIAGLITGNINMAYGANDNAITTISNSGSSYTGTTSVLSSSGGSGLVTVLISNNVVAGQNSAFGNSTTVVTLGSSGNVAGDAAILTNGAVDIGRDIRLAAGTNSGGLKILGANSTQVGNSSFSGDITVGTASGGSNLRVTAPTGVIVSFTGDILEDAATGTGSLNKVGLGTARLTGDNTYAGGTTVTEGVLILDNAAGSATGTGTVSVLDGATLGGGNVAGTTGFASGAVSLASGARIAPGQSAGTLTLQGGLTLNATGGSILDFELASLSTSDMLMITGGNFTGNDSGSTVVNIFELAGFDAGIYTLVDWTGATASGVELGDFQLANDTYSGGLTGSLQIVGSELQLVVVPEPASGALLVACLGLAACARRRRRA